MARLEFHVPDEWPALIDEAADGRPRSVWLRRVLGAELDRTLSAEAVPVRDKQPESEGTDTEVGILGAGSGGGVETSFPPARRFVCGCETTATSPKARCPKHARGF